MDDAILIGSEWYIPAASSRADDRIRVLKHGDTFAVFDRHGEIGPVGVGAGGLYDLGTRHLSQWELVLMGRKPMLLNSTVRLDNSILAVDQTNPDMYRGEELWIPKGVLHLQRVIAVNARALHERIHLRNYHVEPLDFHLELLLGADFRDIFEIRGSRRAARGVLREPRVDTAAVLLRYDGLDGVARTTLIAFDQTPDTLTGGVARFELRLAPQECFALEVEASCGEAALRAPRRGYARAVAALEHAVARDQMTRAEVVTDNEQFNDWLVRSAADLRMLTTDTPHGPYPYAGVPWFATPFGRDGLITALQTLWVQPEMAAGVLAFLAAHQSGGEDPTTDAEPGKILHERREGEMAALGEVPFRSYYGTVDATPLFVVLAGRYHRRTGDHALVDTLWPHIEHAMAWIEHYGDADGDGFVEYAGRGAGGLVQQGWKDSDDSVFHADGRPAEPPIALCEVQAYVYEACHLGAEMAEVLGHMQAAAIWRARRDALREEFERSFWLEALGTYALALDGAKRPCAVRSSNPGHALYCGIVDPSRAARVAAGLLGATGFNGWGVRTVFAGEARYNPMSYHNGSVWPHDTALAAAGLARYGHRAEAIELMTGLFHAATFLDLHRLPELFCGFGRLPGQAPTLYPVACLPQAWASGSIFMLIEACLGIGFSAHPPHIRLHRPRLPAYINRMQIRGLRYGDSRVDLMIRRRATGVAVHTEHREGDLEVAVLV